jgi:hypothetical protein
MAGVVAVTVCDGAQAQEIPSPVPGKRVALRGYDPVAYFTDSRPVQGVARFWYEFDDTVYLFASAEHRAAFVADPGRFAPQFRGFCAVSLSEGGNDDGSPENWTIVDNTLFVFGKPIGPGRFAKDPEGITEKARANWAARQPR